MTEELIAVYSADFIGFLLLIVILIAKGWDLPLRRHEGRILLALIAATLINCLLDPFSYWAEGVSGILSRDLSLVANTFVFIYDLIVCFGFLGMIFLHINKKIKVAHNVVGLLVLSAWILIIFINPFKPMLFRIDYDNIVTRGPLYLPFIITGFLLLTYGLVVYFSARKRNAMLLFFPIWEFVIPIAIGTFTQMAFPKIATQPICFAIAFSGMVICLQNESLFMDKLTGVYNRYELDKLREKYAGSSSGSIAVMMIDMNDFKSINDTFSHAEGDEALVVIAGILLNVVQSDGVVIRFAGDEFVLIVNNVFDNVIEDLKKRISVAVEAYNIGYGKPYNLSVSMGGIIVDLGTDDSTDFLNTVDKLMYEDKKAYYATHDRRRSKMQGKK